jgi:uncharacterized protein YcfL
MKKLFFILMINFIFIGCNSDKEKAKLKEDVNFETIGSTMNKGFKFDKENNYKSGQSTDSILNKSQLHSACTAPCCSESRE